MISLRKHLDAWQTNVEETALTAFRSSLIAMAQCGQRAIPPLGPELNRKLTQIHQSLNPLATPDALNAATRELEQQLAVWADQAFRHHAENEREMREIVGAVAQAAESVSQRDEKYSARISDLTGKLKNIAELNDLPAIRRSIVESAGALRSCVEQMAEESRNSVSQLSKQVEEYRTKLRETEKMSGQDPLTDLANRRAFEQQLQVRIAARAVFSLMLIDLNGFKAINDRHGHLAGDDLLRQFAAELRSQFGPEDLVSRWGGDEFAVLVFAGLKEAQSRADGVKRWALGDYKISAGQQQIKVPIGASIGIAQWDGSESPSSLLARADKAVYAAKPQ